MSSGDDELQQRVCRSCQQSYTYPVLRSEATRFYCEACMALPPTVRTTFERFNKRINQLAGDVDKLQHRLQAASGGDGTNQEQKDAKPQAAGRK